MSKVQNVNPNQIQQTNSDQQPIDNESKQIFLRAKQPQAPFLIAKNDLIKLSDACQERNFSEEIDIIEKLGGDEWLEKGLCTNFKSGISGLPEDLEKRIYVFQSNQKQVVPSKTFFELLIEALGDFTLIILSISSVVSIVLQTATASDEDRPHAWIEGFAILIAVLVCSNVTAINDYQKEKQFQKLNNVADARKTVSILRNGQIMNEHMSNVLVGDVIILSEGMEIPADGYVIQADELTTDESAMTGETDPVKKQILTECIQKRDELIYEGCKNTSGRHDVPSCIIMSGTRILTGEGKLLITVVGDSSCAGKISALLRQNDPEETPLQMKLTKVAEDIGKSGLISAITIVIAMLIRFAIERITENKWNHSEHWAEIVNFFIIGITVVVVAIPEGLPLAVTLSLAYSVKKMLLEQNLVRKLKACETMGGANNICSDKTGTLTQNVMTLTTLWNDEYIEFKHHEKTMNINDYIPSDFQNIYLLACAINSSAQLRPDKRGSKTEIAILQQLDKMGFNYETIKDKYHDIIKKMPFSSSRKRMSIIIQDPDTHKTIMFTKGASEIIMRSCNRYHGMKSGVRYLNEGVKQLIEQNIKKMADNALRTIGLAYKEIQGDEDFHSKNNYGVFDIETKDLTLMGIFGIADVIRPEVPKAIQQCKTAGITVRMVTGDNKDTAKAIAKQCGLIDENDLDALVIEGPKFSELTGGIICKKCRTAECDCPRDMETAKKAQKEVRIDTIKNGKVFDELIINLRVMARSRPEDKYALVTGLIERDNVVAVTGDGTNDAPALKKADVGFAMGIAGTEVAREAAAIILLDDNFKSIVSAVLWGRNIYDSIKKFIQFQLTVNIVAVFITLIGAVVLKQEVLTPVQMLWINLIMDTLASLALATEPPNELLLLRKPHNRYEYIASKKMCKHIIGQSILQIIIILVMVFDGHNFLPEYPDTCQNFNKKCFDDVIIQKYYIKNVNNDVWPDYIQHSIMINYTNDQKTAEYSYPYMVRYSDSSLKYVTPGRFKNYDGIEYLYQNILNKFQKQPSRHYTYVFNTFVMLQIFNFLNSRKLNDEINILEGISKNLLFFYIIFLIFGCQILIISLGDISFSCYSYGGLLINQWLICVGFGSLSLLNSVIIKLIPEDKVICFNLGWGDKAVRCKDNSENEEQKKNEIDKINIYAIQQPQLPDPNDLIYNKKDQKSNNKLPTPLPKQLENPEINNLTGLNNISENKILIEKELKDIPQPYEYKKKLSKQQLDLEKNNQE